LLLFLGIAVSAGLFIFNPRLQWYAGLSGVLHGLLAAGALRMVMNGKPTYLVLAGLLVIKLAYEHRFGPLPVSEMLVPQRVIVDAHVYGAVAGVLAVAFMKVSLQEADRA
jgi:rhomboid family GlyGly-CTERM serine protease